MQTNAGALIWHYGTIVGARATHSGAKHEISGARAIGAKCPGTSGTVPDLELLSRVPHGTYFLADMSRKFYSTGLTNNYNLPITLVNSL